MSGGDLELAGKKWRLRTQRVHQHVHVRVFVASPPYATFALAGKLTLNADEFEYFATQLEADVVEEAGTP